MTIVRRIMALPTPPVEHVECLGIDDFAFRRGRTFGTVVVDLDSHQIIDLLPDRQVETAAAWMAAHPEITHVSRDRGAEYASAASTGARKRFRSPTVSMSARICRMQCSGFSRGFSLN
jgi:transposase